MGLDLGVIWPGVDLRKVTAQRRWTDTHTPLQRVTFACQTCGVECVEAYHPRHTDDWARAVIYAWDTARLHCSGLT